MLGIICFKRSRTFVDGAELMKMAPGGIKEGRRVIFMIRSFSLVHPQRVKQETVLSRRISEHHPINKQMYADRIIPNY